MFVSSFGPSYILPFDKWKKTKLFLQIATLSIYASFSHWSMGAVWTQLNVLWKSFRRDSGILILGLDNAGKTALLYSLHLGEVLKYTVPTIGFNVEQVKIGNIEIHMWDIGGQTRFRALWPHYFAQADGIAFVVDCNDVERLDMARDELHGLMSHKDLTGKPFLILANKQDLPMAIQKAELITRLNLNHVDWTPWHVVECSATKNMRAKVGFEWLSEKL